MMSVFVLTRETYESTSILEVFEDRGDAELQAENLRYGEKHKDYWYVVEEVPFTPMSP